MINYLIKLLVISMVFFTSSAFATSYSGKVEHLQLGDAAEADIIMGVDKDSYLLVTLNPTPTFVGGTNCNVGDSSNRLMVDPNTYHGKLMFSLLLAAKAAGQTVTLNGANFCFNHSSGSLKWEEVKTIKVH